MKNLGESGLKNMSGYVLEVCVDSVESAIAAKKGGATRLELCENLVIGGTTPSIELFTMVKELTGLPIHVLIRPRFGDFLYTEYEYELMCRQIRKFADAGADAVVIGSLNADGTLNEPQMQGMIQAAGGKKITLHRAFDASRNLLETLETARELGVHAILTSGGEKNCYEGRNVIKELLDAAEGVEILIGAGVNADVIVKLCSMMPARNFHMSGKKVCQSGMKCRNQCLSMGLAGLNEFEIWRTDEAAIAEAVLALREKN